MFSIELGMWGGGSFRVCRLRIWEGGESDTDSHFGCIINLLSKLFFNLLLIVNIIN